MPFTISVLWRYILTTEEDLNNQPSLTVGNGINYEYTESLLTIDTMKSESLIFDEKKELSEDEELPYQEKKGIFWAISIAYNVANKFYGDYISPFAALVGVSGWLMGFLTSIRNLISSLFQGIFGRLSDRYGRKLFLSSSLVLSFIITTLLIFLGNQTTIIIASVFQSLAICIFGPAWNASIGDITKIEGRGSFIGKLSAAGQVVSVSTSLFVALAFFLVEIFEGQVFLGWTVYLSWQQQYMIAFSSASFSFLITFVLVLFYKETNIEKDKVALADERQINLLEPFGNANFRRFLLIHIAYSIVMSAIWPVVPYVQINILNMKVYQIAITSATFAVCMGIFQIVSGKLADKVGRKRFIIIGAAILVLFPIGYTPAIIYQRWEFSILANVIAGTGSGFFYSTINTYILDQSGKKTMGTFIGWKETLTGIATFLGSLSGGFIIDALNNKYGLIIMGISMTIGVTVLRFIAFFGYLFVKEKFVNNNVKN